METCVSDSVDDQIRSDQSDGLTALQTIELNPRLNFSQEERKRVKLLLELDQSNMISFNDLEYEVASKVIQEMFDKAFSNTTMDYELIFWGYTFAVKKITWFAQVIWLDILEGDQRHIRRLLRTLPTVPSMTKRRY